MNFDHIGIFVRDLAEGRHHLQKLFIVGEFTPEYEDRGLGVKVQFGHDSAGVCYELVAPFGEHDPVSPVLEAGRAILNHVAYRVNDLQSASCALRRDGSVPLGPPRPAVAFGGRRVMFFLTPLRFIVELIENEC